MGKQKDAKRRKRKPYKFDVHKREQWLEEYRKLGSKMAACEAVKITRQTLYDTMGSQDPADKEFTERATDIKYLQNDVVRGNLFTLSRTHPVAGIFWLCNRDPENWKHVQNVQHTGGDKNKPIILEYVPAKRREATG